MPEHVHYVMTQHHIARVLHRSAIHDDRYKLQQILHDLPITHMRHMYTRLSSSANKISTEKKKQYLHIKTFHEHGEHFAHSAEDI